ncbi:MAG: hypothetical protein Q9185_006889, partial [Variospora sp. 1 TL-2023]
MSTLLLTPVVKWLWDLVLAPRSAQVAEHERRLHEHDVGLIVANDKLDALANKYEQLIAASAPNGPPIASQ